MNRRAFVTGVGALLATPFTAEAQGGKVLRIGIVVPGTAQPAITLISAFQQGLHEFGDIEGENVALEIRYTDGRLERLRDLAAELVHLKVDIILAPSNPAIAAAQKATTSIPIVMLLANEPVALGFVASFARPGGNITGHLFSDAEAAAPKLGLQLQLVAARSPGELDGTFALMTRQRAGAVFFVGSPLHFSHRTRIAELAVKRRLPTMCGAREYVEAGCLMSYGANFTDQYRRAAYFVDRILKGAKPADLPVEQPTKFEFIINLRTAKALGLTIPPSLLLRADQVIE